MKRLFTVALLAASCAAGAGAAVPSDRLIGQWQGRDRFFGMSQEEIAAKKVEAQDVDTALTITAEGNVEGRVGGATLRDCMITSNRGWLGRWLHLKTDYIIRGKITGAVLPGSEGGIHEISAPLNCEGDKIAGSIFVLRQAFSSPYPFLRLSLDRRTVSVADLDRNLQKNPPNRSLTPTRRTRG